MSEEAASEPSLAEFGGFEFCRVEAGWIDFRVAIFPMLGMVTATHVADPFPAMVQWLEGITRNELCEWTVAEEGCAARFVFLPPSDTFLGDTRAILVAMRADADWGGSDAIFNVEAVPINPGRFARRAYESFRSFVESDAYRPEEWEAESSIRAADDDEPEDAAWDGEALRRLRSKGLEELVQE